MCYLATLYIFYQNIRQEFIVLPNTTQPISFIPLESQHGILQAYYMYWYGRL